MTAPAERPDIRRGSVIADRYELTEPIAAGGMAQVWRGVDQRLTRPIAVKVMYEHLRHDPAFVQRFRREAQASARLVHPNIVAIYDTVSTPEVDAIVMELIDGTTLREHLDRRGPLDEPSVRRIGRELAGALHCAHGSGVVHRDIKPANILVTKEGSVRLADFGIAKAHEDPDLTVAGTLVGTAAYLAPEQVGAGTIDQRTDLYSLSTVLYEAASGTIPFRGDSPTATALARLHQDPIPLRSAAPGLSESLCTSIMRNLERAPERRFQSALDFSAALAGRDQGVATTPPEPVTGPVGGGTTGTGSGSVTGRAQSIHHPIGSDEPPDVAPHRRRPHRSVVGRLVLALLLIAPLALIAALLAQDSGTIQPTAPRVRLVPVPIASVIPFDPFGSGTPGENNANAPRAIDGDPATAWKTESYDAQGFGTKPGVGLVVNLADSRVLDHLVVRSSPGWSGEVFVAGENLADRTELPPGGRAFTATTASTDIDLSAAVGSSVLIWITDLGPSSGRHRVDIFEVSVVSRETGDG